MSLLWKNQESMKIKSGKQNSILLNLLVLLFLSSILFTACDAKDDMPPVIMINGADTLSHVLNEIYNDPGATATDDVDGNVTSKIYVNNEVDSDRVGEYTVTYSVVDEAGNEAIPQSRVVYVYNTGLTYYGNYQATDSEVFPGLTSCSYPSYIWIDSTINDRLIFLDFACSSNREVFADVTDSSIIIPYQLIQDTVINMSLQGSGYINDSVVWFEYTKIDSIQTSYWNVKFIREK